MGETLENLQRIKEMVFTITITPAPTRKVRVAYMTRDGTATVASGDYTPISGILIFEIGETTKLVRVPVDLPEHDEELQYFYLDISWVGRPFISILSGTGIIDFDDYGVYMLINENHGTITDGSVTIDALTAGVHSFTLGSTDTEVIMDTFSRSGRLVSVMLMITQDSAGLRTITWPDNFRWQGGFSPSLSTAAGATDVVQVLTTDSGTTWIASIAYQVSAL